MNNNLVVFSYYFPSIKHGGGIANLSTLKAYSVFFSKVDYIILSDFFEKEPKYDNVTFHKIKTPFKRKWLRFLLSILYNLPAVTIVFKQKSIEKQILDIFDDTIIKNNSQPFVIFEDIPIAYYLEVLKKKYPNIKYGVRSHNVLSDIFLNLIKITPVGILWLYETKKIRKFEKQIFESANFVWAISEKDKNTYFNRYKLKCDGVISIEYQADLKIIGYEDINNIIYLGSVDLRKKEGMKSFIDISWPIIKNSLPNAKLLLGGNNTESFSNINKSIYGYGKIENQSDFLKKGLIFINTQTTGSGIKLKSIIAMLSSRLLITTDIGIEGIEGDNKQHFIIANNWIEFAQQVIESAKNISTSIQIAENGKLHFEQFYNFDNFYSNTSKLLDKFVL
ncbi:MAG: glycosyltransferase family 4 protein [Candidatus Delongbacteria bacterium]